MKIMQLITFFTLFWTITGSNINAINYTNINLCTKYEFFNGKTLKCQLCDIQNNLVPTADKLNCKCNTLFKSFYNFTSKLLFPICQQCTPGSVFLQEINTCIKCVNGIKKLNNSFVCKPCKENEIMIYQYANGLILNQTRCVQCLNSMIPSKDGTKCITCPIYNPIIINGTVKCMCDYKNTLVGNLCIPKTTFPELSTSTSKFYLEYNSGLKLKSKLFDTQLKSNIYLCKLQNTTACQVSANLCTLTLFHSYENSPCNLWHDSRYLFTSQKLNELPWLFYNKEDTSSILNSDNIPVVYSMKTSSSVNKLQFTAAVFNLDGTLKEIKTLTGSDLNLCPDINFIKNEGLRFGINYKYTCEVEAKQFFEAPNTEFIEPYLHYFPNSSSMLYPVPVLIKNIQQNNDTNPSNWMLVRRYFVFDTVSSVPPEGGKPPILRYIKSVHIRVKLRPDPPKGRIYVPIFIIEYDNISQHDLASKKITFKFSTEYKMDDYLKQPIEISVAVLSTISVIYSIVQTWSHSKRSGKTLIDLVTLIRICIFLCGNLANVFFIVACGASIYVFIFYKGQSVVHILLPPLDQEIIIKNFIIAAFSLKIIEIINLIWEQTSIDIFFIDWEKPKPRDTLPRPKKTESASENCYLQTVSIWRSYFIANEWHEIQTLRKINFVTHILLLTFMLQVLVFENFGTVVTELETHFPRYLKQNHFNFTCKLGAGCIIYICVYLLQLLFRIVIYERFVKDSIQQFVDICSLANISVFIMSLNCYGYYIHGKSSQGFSDTDMATILKQLQREEENLCGNRGLLTGTQNQTFTAGVPLKLRLFYNKLMMPTKSDYLKHNLNVSINPTKRDNKNRKDKFDIILQSYYNVNKLLSAYIEHALKEIDYIVIDKHFMESLLNIEFTDYTVQGILYTDDGHSFDNVLFYGNELCLFLFDIILYSFILLLCDDFILTGIIIIFIEQIIKKIRNFAGKKNLAAKTLIDERFFI